HVEGVGVVERHNLVVERRYSGRRAERFAEFAAVLARANLELHLVTRTPAALAVKNATKTIPVVLTNSIDPVGVGLVASLARPGGNITGTSQQAPDIFAKRLSSSCKRSRTSPRLPCCGTRPTRRTRAPGRKS